MLVNMNDQKSELDIEIDSDKSTAIASNGRIDAIAFNLDLIRAENPELADEIRRLYEKAKNISPDAKLDGVEEDIALVSDMFKKALKRDS